MDMPRLGKSVRRITVLQPDGAGSVSPVVLYQRDRKKKKGTAIARPFEKAARQVAEASDRYTSTYLRRHKKANRKRKDGWVRDFPENVVKATNKARKQIRPSALFGL